jgi:hypothetical protein
VATAVLKERMQPIAVLTFTEGRSVHFFWHSGLKVMEAKLWKRAHTTERQWIMEDSILLSNGALENAISGLVLVYCEVHGRTPWEPPR